MADRRSKPDERTDEERVAAQAAEQREQQLAQGAAGAAQDLGGPQVDASGLEPTERIPPGAAGGSHRPDLGGTTALQTQAGMAVTPGTLVSDTETWRSEEAKLAETYAETETPFVVGSDAEERRQREVAHAVALERSTHSTLAQERARGMKCPNCNGKLLRHPADSPHKGGAFHCDTCGGCWVQGDDKELMLRPGHPGPTPAGGGKAFG